ncbi:MAG: hypothetical protein JXA46_12495 [Dehalococcoidales bacterium]|nr:hypothetical protein [Dehalococcoidales bacterium]
MSRSSSLALAGRPLAAFMFCLQAVRYEKYIGELDRLVDQHVFQSRSQAIQ